MFRESTRRLNGEDDLFEDYKKFNMSKAAYYFEKQLDQLYLIVFYIQELHASGIRSDEEDFYERTVPYEVMSEPLQAIVYDDAEYSEYLLRRRKIEGSI